MRVDKLWKKPMSGPTTVILERNSPRLAAITFSNPPANVTVVKTVARLAKN